MSGIGRPHARPSVWVRVRPPGLGEESACWFVADADEESALRRVGMGHNRADLSGSATIRPTT